VYHLYMRDSSKKFLMLLALGIFCTVIFLFIFYTTSRFKLAVISGKLPTSARLFGYKLIKDPQSIFSIEIPNNWNYLFNKSNDVLIASVSAQSPDYVLSDNTGDARSTLPPTIKSGAILKISVTSGVLSTLDVPSGDIESQKRISLGSKEASYYTYKNFGMVNVITHEIRFDDLGRVFMLSISYNPDNYKDGEKEFIKLYGTFNYVH
jgi:hypothetical protein